MDRKRLIGEISARHGVRLDEDDPAFVMATLAELTLRNAQADLIEAIRRETAEFVRAAAEVQEAAGARLASAIQGVIREVPVPALPPRSGPWICGVSLFVAGLIIGRILGS